MIVDLGRYYNKNFNHARPCSRKEKVKSPEIKVHKKKTGKIYSIFIIYSYKVDVKRADTVSSSMPITIDTKIKLRKELDDMAVLKYHITQGKIEKEYKITSTILGKGSYAVVKLAERIDNAEFKVAVKIYEKCKLYTNKHRRKNLCNEIMVLK